MAERTASIASEPGIAADTPLAGQHAVVTGAGRGIGAAIAVELGRRGASLSLMGRTAATLEARRGELADSFGAEVRYHVVDVSDEAAVAQAFEAATGELGAVSVLVNNAGVALSAPLAKTGLELWERTLSVNLTGAFLCCRQVVAGMRAAGRGRIVNIASTAGLVGYGYISAYCASKHGLVGLTRALASELAKTGITVNAVCPGYTETDITAATITTIVEKTGRSADQALAELVKHNPQGRLIEPREVAETVAWLCLPSSAAITGQAIAVAGGEVT
jgi:NAD(P)-dependent dehydrogenase (short-subunit alcohol dehydrogenase family)